MPRSSEQLPNSKSASTPHSQKATVAIGNSDGAFATATKLISGVKATVSTEPATSAKLKNYQLIENLQSIVDDLVSKLAREKLANAQLETRIRDEVFQEYLHLHKELERRYSDQKREAIDDVQSLTDARVQLIKQFVAEDQSIDSSSKSDAEGQVHEDTCKDDSLAPACLLQNKQLELDWLRHENERLQTELNHFRLKYEHFERQKREGIGLDQTRPSNKEVGAQTDLIETKEERDIELGQLKKILLKKEREVQDLNEVLEEAGGTFQSMEQQISELQGLVETLKLEKDNTRKSRPNRQSFPSSQPHSNTPPSTDSGVRISSNIKVAHLVPNDSLLSSDSLEDSTGTAVTAYDVAVVGTDTTAGGVAVADNPANVIHGEIDPTDRCKGLDMASEIDLIDGQGDRFSSNLKSSRSKESRSPSKKSPLEPSPYEKEQRGSGSKKKRVSLRVNRFRKTIKVSTSTPRRGFDETVRLNRAFMLKWVASPALLHNHATGSTHEALSPMK